MAYGRARLAAAQEPLGKPVDRRRPSSWPACISGLIAAALVACTTAACSGTPVQALGTSIQIACPSSATVDSLKGEPVPVNFGVPTISGGSQPVNVTCSTPSGALFSAGTTSVICTARDARQQTASCGLNVTVTKVGTLSASRFMAFGDSITWGSMGECPIDQVLSHSPTFGLSLRELLHLSPRDIEPAPYSTSYPSVLANLLANRYLDQPINMVNEGCAGEHINGFNSVPCSPTTALQRLRKELLDHSPQGVLLLDGINDVNDQNGHAEGLAAITDTLRDMVHEIRQRNATVLLGTLLPEVPICARAARGNGYLFVPTVNDQIRSMALSENVPIVDLYQAFGASPGPYIGADGLHPTEIGYEKIAHVFLDVIRAKLEVPR